MGKVFFQSESNSSYMQMERHITIRDFLCDYFKTPESPQANYFIIDPFLNPLHDIYIPLRDGNIDDSFPCDLISTLAMEHPNRVVFSIITKMDVRELSKTLFIDRGSVPSVEFRHKEFEWCSIRVCKYAAQKKPFPSELHDRWLLQENDNIVRGIHIGPSLSDFNGKDITVTDFDPESCRVALSRFKDIWTLCEAKRE